MREAGGPGAGGTLKAGEDAPETVDLEPALW